MSGNPSFSHFGVDGVNGYLMANSSGMLGADVPPFRPSMPPPDHGGFGLGFCFGDAAAGGATAAAADIGAQFAANNLMLASLASQLFAPAPAPHGGHLAARMPPEEEMNGGYDAASCDGSGPARLLCPGQSDAHAMTVWSSSKKPYCDWSDADGSRTESVHGSYHLAGPPEVAGFHYLLTAGHTAAAPSELSLSLCSKSSSDSMVNTANHCSSEASHSDLTHICRVESELPQVYCSQARSRPAHFAVVVARSRYAAVAQQVLNDVVCRVLFGVAEAADDSASGTRPSLQASSCSAGAPSAVSSNNQLMSSPEEHPCGGDAGARWGEAKRVRSELLKMLQLMDQKYNQCLDEIQSTTGKFNGLMQSGSGNGSICAPFAHRAVSAMYRGLRRRITGEIMVAAASRPSLGESSVTAAAGGERERSWESAFIQKHSAVQQLRCGEQQCWRPQRGLPEKSVAVLKAWMFENFLRPYPKDCEKDMLAARSGLSRNQVSNWFINARVRLWKPMIEEMYKELKRRSGGGGEGPAMEQLSSQDVVG